MRLPGFGRKACSTKQALASALCSIVASMDNVPLLIVRIFLYRRHRDTLRAWTLGACAGFCALWAVQAEAQHSVDQVAAYGRVSAGERAVTLSVPYYLNSPPVVAELFVKEGDHVVRHQKLAVTQSQLLASADLAMAKAHLSTAEERLQVLNAAPKSQEIATQEALIKSLEAEARAEKAKKRPDTTAGKDEATAREEAAEAKVAMSQHQLGAMREVRPADLAVAGAEVEEAKAAVVRAQALLAFTEVEAPFDGQILKILSYPGEDGSRGLLEIGSTEAMVIKGELNVGDASRVRVGARATIKSEAWQGEMAGRVTRIDSRVKRSELTTLSTFANVDRQIVEATITPETPEKLEGLTGAEVTVTIDAGPAAK
jgi:HlyD family secretion protein